MEWQHPNQTKRSAPVPSHQLPEAEKPKQIIRALVVVGIMAGVYWLATRILPTLVGLHLVSKQEELCVRIQRVIVVPVLVKIVRQDVLVVDNFITITEEAHKAIKSFVLDDEVLRVGVKGGGCSGLSYLIQTDTLTDNDDMIFDFEEFKVVIDNKSIIYIKGMELDYTTGLEGKGFQFKNPNASSTCGCGESFSMY